MENRDYYLQLLEKYRDNRCSPQEVELLLGYFRKDSPEQEQLMELVLAHLQQEPDGEELKSKHLENTIDQAFLTIQKEIKHSGASKSKGTRQLWTRILAAAMTLMIVGVAYQYFVNSKQGEHQNAADVKPGHSAATLTLAGGKKIVLNEVSNGNIASESGINVSKTANGEIIYTAAGSKENDGASDSRVNILSTANGETYQIVLSDGTKVWLNAATVLQFPANLRERGLREVKLVSGEAYFKVFKDKKRPFVVTTATQKVEVLGTQFNINSYTDQGRTVTTLEEESVKVSSLNSKASHSGNEVILRPGQQSLSTNGGFNVRSADLQIALAWRDGLMKFKDTPLRSILQEASRWYDIEVEYNGTPSMELFTGGISRSERLEGLLKVLQLNGIKFRVVERNNHRKLIVNP